MRNLTILNKYRDVETALKLYGFAGDHETGIFHVPSATDDEAVLKIIASVGDGWDHVSISLPNRCPTWAEMEQIKRAFFKDEETAMQLHVPPSDHISVHPFCLHLWRPLTGKIPMPPAWMVGPKARAA